MLNIDGAIVRAEVTGKIGQPGMVRLSIMEQDGSWTPLAETRGTEIPAQKRLKRLVREHRYGPQQLCTVCGLMKEPPRIMIARECKRCQVEAARELRAAGEQPPLWAKNIGEW